MTSAQVAKTSVDVIVDNAFAGLENGHNHI